MIAMMLLIKEYTDESLVDLQEDVWESVNKTSEHAIPVDEDGFRTGKFIVKVEWVSE